MHGGDARPILAAGSATAGWPRPVAPGSASAGVTGGIVQRGKPSVWLEVAGVHAYGDPPLICTIPTVVAVDGGSWPPSSAQAHSTTGGYAEHPLFDGVLCPRFDVVFGIATRALAAPGVRFRRAGCRWLRCEDTPSCGPSGCRGLRRGGSTEGEQQHGGPLTAKTAMLQSRGRQVSLPSFALSAQARPRTVMPHHAHTGAD